MSQVSHELRCVVTLAGSLTSQHATLLARRHARARARGSATRGAGASRAAPQHRRHLRHLAARRVRRRRIGLADDGRLEDVLLFNTSDASNGSRPVVDADLRKVVRDTILVGSSRYVGRDAAGDSSNGDAHQNDRAAITLEIEDRPAQDWRARFSAAGLQRALLNLICASRRRCTLLTRRRQRLQAHAGRGPDHAAAVAHSARSARIANVGDGRYLSRASLSRRSR